MGGTCHIIGISYHSYNILVAIQLDILMISGVFSNIMLSHNHLNIFLVPTMKIAFWAWHVI